MQTSRTLSHPTSIFALVHLGISTTMFNTVLSGFANKDISCQGDTGCPSEFSGERKGRNKKEECALLQMISYAGLYAWGINTFLTKKLWKKKSKPSVSTIRYTLNCF